MRFEDALDDLKFWTKDREWLIKFRDPREILQHHAPYVYVEFVMYFWAFMTLVHAVRNGGRFKYLWFGVLFHGFVVESLSYFVPDIDNFWHAQSTIMFLGGRLPLYIVLAYPCFCYTAYVAAAHMSLPWWAEPCAVGLGEVIADLPYDIIGVKFLLWSWHDTDPNIYDRHMWVPWTSYYFHATFGAGFALLFRNTHRLFASDKDRLQSAGFFREMFCVVISSLFAMPLGILQFLPIYHPLHDSLKIHTEICVIIVLGLYALIVWSADRQKDRGGIRKKSYAKEIMIGLLVWYSVFMFIVTTGKPEEMRSTGLHEPVGNCNETLPVHTALGQVLQKKKYLCLDKYDEGYFDFHCTKKPKSGVDWYTICGTAFGNHAEYIVVITAECLLGLWWFYQLFCRSADLPKNKPKQTKTKTH